MKKWIVVLRKHIDRSVEINATSREKAIDKGAKKKRANEIISDCLEVRKE